MQRLFNVEKWFTVGDGKAVSFANPLPRRVKIDVNAAEPVRIDYADGDGAITFLANVLGRDTIEFRCYGEFSLTVSGGDCNMYTVDGEEYSFSVPDAVSFTKPASQRVRNPELERMQVLMQQNMRKLMNEQKRELEFILRQREAAPVAAAPVSAGAAAGAADSGKPVKAGDTKSDAKSEPADAGSATAKGD